MTPKTHAKAPQKVHFRTVQIIGGKVSRTCVWETTVYKSKDNKCTRGRISTEGIPKMVDMIREDGLRWSRVEGRR